jgi:hypothetical protein
VGSADVNAYSRRSRAATSPRRISARGRAPSSWVGLLLRDGEGRDRPLTRGAADGERGRAAPRKHARDLPQELRSPARCWTRARGMAARRRSARGARGGLRAEEVGCLRVAGAAQGEQRCTPSFDPRERHRRALPAGPS